ncbi:MAG: histidine utilization repressor [Acidobacteriota bacterium]
MTAPGGGTGAARPLYQQIKDRIMARIQSGDWAPGRRIPSENAIVRELGVSRMTVHRALRELASEGYLLRVAGVGTFVAEAPRQTSLVELRDIADEVRRAGAEHSAQVLTQVRRPVKGEVAERLELDPGSEAFRVTLVHAQDGLPIQHEDRWIVPAFLPDALDLDFSLATPSQVLLERVAADEMEHVVQAVAPDEDLRRLLALDAAEPCLRLERRTWNHGRVVTFARLTYPGGRYGLGARYSLRPEGVRDAPEFRPVSPAGRKAP